MNGVLSFVLGLSLAGGATCLAVFVLGLPFKKLVKKSWLFYLWLIVLFRFIVPLPLDLPFVTDGIQTITAAISGVDAAPQQVSSPVDLTQSEATGSVNNAPATAFDASASAISDHDTATAGDPISPPAPNNNAEPDSSINEPLTITLPGALDGLSLSEAARTDNNAADNAAPTITLLGLLPYLWLAVAGAILVWTVVSYAGTIVKLRRGRTLITPGRVPVYESDQLTTPVLAGLLRPAIYLPAGFPHAELAIRHELTHLRRGDIWLKWLMQLVVCIHWFNPLAWLMKREINRLCELACDSMMLRHLAPSERTGYGQMLLDTAKTVSGKSGALAVSLGNDKRLMTERLTEVLKAGKLSKKAVAAMSLLTAVILSSAVIFGAFLSGCTATPATGDQTASPSLTASASPSATTPTTAPEGFVNDPDVIGTWEPFNYAHTVTDFIPGEKLAFSGYSLVIAPNGVTSMPNMTWTKGSVLVANYGYTQDYTIREIDGSKYLFLKRQDGYQQEYLGEAYEYRVYKWTSEEVEFQLYTDDIDLPFVDDPDVHGTWRYVRNAISSSSTYMSDDIRVESFSVSSLFLDDYYHVEMSFSGGGTLSTTTTMALGSAQPISSELLWTKGVVINPYLKTASAYELREISGTTYLIMENKDERYIRSKPENRLTKNYMIWIRNPEPSPAEISLPEGTPPGFIDAPALVGTWMPYGLAGDDFEFITNWYTGSAIVAYENGWTNEPNMTWSKGRFTLTGNYEVDDRVRDYVIREIGGRRFLFVKPMASLRVEFNYVTDYEYFAYLWVSDPVPDAVYTDDIDLPFVDDPAVLGDWKIAASVLNIDDYKPPASPQYVTYMPQRTMTFKDGGALSPTTAGTTAPPGFSWTNGTVIDPYLKTASAYEFREIDGETYLFMENKDTPNYTHMHVIGGYTVWKKTS